MTKVGRGGKGLCPQPTNRGAQFTGDVRVGVDWVSGTVWGESVETVEEQLSAVVPCEWVEMEHGDLGYERMARGIAGARVLWADDREDVHFDLPGRWCESVGPLVMRALLSWLFMRGKGTRLDLAADDYRKRKSPGDVDELIRRGAAVTRARAGRLQRDRPTLGETCELGKRGSRQFLRVYDKEAESAGEVPAYRWEMELRKEAAQAALATIVLDGHSFGEVWAGRLRRFVEFREREGVSCVTRAPLMQWFEELIGAAVRAGAYLAERPVVSAATALEWVRRQVAPTLAALLEASGGDVDGLFRLLASGRARHRPQHRLIAAQGVVW